MLRRLHESGEQTAYPFDAWGEIQGFEESLRRFNRADFEDMQQMRDGIARLRAHLEADGTPVRLCHCNSYAPNFLLDRADKMYLIDWEYSGMSDPAWDIGTFIACADYTMDEADGIIRRYMGREPSREELRHHLGYVAVRRFTGFCGRCIRTASARASAAISTSGTATPSPIRPARWRCMRTDRVKRRQTHERPSGRSDL